MTTEIAKVEAPLGAPTANVVRGCGTRAFGGIYLTCKAGPGGLPITDYLIDPPSPVPTTITIPKRGMKLVEWPGAPPLLFDRVGLKDYPNVLDFVLEAQRYGVSRRADGLSPQTLATLGPESRLLLVHDRAFIANAQEYAPLSHPCPKALPDHIATPPTAPADFWGKVVPAPTGCWLWVPAGGVGYGEYHPVGLAYGKVWAHRRAWELTYGPIPEGMEVCHACDLKPCVRPDHLFLGTHADNMADMQAKGHHPAASGEKAGRAKLTDAEVGEIRSKRAAGAPVKVLGAEYGVHHSQIVRICNGSTWKTQPPTEAARVSSLRGDVVGGHRWWGDPRGARSPTPPPRLVLQGYAPNRWRHAGLRAGHLRLVSDHRSRGDLRPHRGPARSGPEEGGGFRDWEQHPDHPRRRLARPHQGGP